jgi:pantothenate kinase type III
MLTRIARELSDRKLPPAPVVATGGMASVVAPWVPAIDHIAPDLALEGLRIVQSLNREHHG